MEPGERNIMEANKKKILKKEDKNKWTMISNCEEIRQDKDLKTKGLVPHWAEFGHYVGLFLWIPKREKQMRKNKR